MSTSLPYSYTTLIDGFSKGVDQSGPFYRVVYKLNNWSDSDGFCNALLGFGHASGPGGTTVTKGSPHQYPLSTNLFCQSAVVVEGLGNPILSAAGTPNYDGGALVQAEYRPAKFDFGPLDYNNTNNQIDPGTPLTYCTQELDFNTETLLIEGHMAGDVPAKIQVPTTVLNLTFHELPYLPVTAMRNLRGRVNSTAFLGAATGLVLFRGGSTQRKFNADGSVVQEVKLCFEERDSHYPWNSGPTKGAPYTWVPVVDTNGNKPYKTADLNPLVIF